MATYVFRCGTCDELTECKDRRFGDNHVPDHCMHCEGTELTQVIGANDFQLKGSGWYKAGHYPRDWKMKERK